MSGLNTRQRTMTRTTVNASSINLNFESFSFPSYFRPSSPGDACIFSASGKRIPEDEGKPESENTLLSKEEDCPAPLLRRSGLPDRRASLDLQEKIYANTRGPGNGESDPCQKKTDAIGDDTTIL